MEDINKIKKMNSDEIIDYLYKVGLSNVFDNYNKRVSDLNQAKKKQIEDAYYLDQINKRYLGEYASNVGLNDLSGSLQKIASDYTKNLSNINAEYDTSLVSAEEAYREGSQDLYNSYAANILNQVQTKEANEQQISSEILANALENGFYGYNPDGSLMSLDQFLGQEQYENLPDIYKNYLLQTQKRNEELAKMSAFTVDNYDEDGIQFNKNAVADYLTENLSSLKDADATITKGEIRRFMEKGKTITLSGNSLKISDKSVGLTDANGNYYVSVEETVDKTNSNKYNKFTNSNLASSADLTNQYETENNGARPVKDDVILYKDEGTGHYDYYYYDGNNWHCMVMIGKATEGAYTPKEKKEKKERTPEEEKEKLNEWGRRLMQGLGNLHR